MKKMLLAAATALSMAAVPAMAQDANDGTTFQSAAHLDTLSDEQRAEYDSWTIEFRDYYDGLEPDYRGAWWYLTDEQRMQLYDMAEADRVRTWSAIMAQMENRGDMDRQFVSNTMVQTIPASTRQNGDYPVCTSDLDDHCINAWAAGQRGPGVDRPLQYWPGESVTEMRSGG